MRSHMMIVATFCLVCGTNQAAHAQQMRRPYRLNSTDLKQRVIWGAECRAPAGQGLAFGGQDQDASDGRPRTRILKDGRWQAIHDELRKRNPLQETRERVWSMRQRTKNMLARVRAIYFKGMPSADEQALLQREVVPQVMQLTKDLVVEEEVSEKSDDDYVQGQGRLARRYLQKARKLLPSFNEGISARKLQGLYHVQIQLEQAAEALDAEPPARAMNCGTARLSGDKSGPAGDTLAYDPQTKLYVLFGGDHLDYLTNDTWVFDPKQQRWFQRHPKAAPPPRANHRFESVGGGAIRLTGGYTYSSNTDYVGGQYVDLDDGPWTFDLAKNAWTGGQLVAADSRVYRKGPFHPDFYLTGDKPNAATFEAWLKEIPVNEWVPTNPPHLPRLNRDWGTARVDTDRDMILRWSGGHSAHGGTDVLHFHFSTNRWELPFPVEFPLGQLYSNTSYPNGYNFNLRPWMTGHTYQNYAYDPPSKKMIKAGRPRYYYVYDPDLGDWIGRGEKPKAMQYNSCFYTLTLVATPHGIVCWDRYGKVHRYDHRKNQWVELEITGDTLPGAYVDNSTIAYDARRNRVLMISTGGYRKPYDGRVWAVDLKTHAAKKLVPDAREHANRFANVDRCCYDEVNDLLLLGTYLKDMGAHTRTPAYDCRTNRWVTLDLKYSTGTRPGNTTRQFPHGRSDGLMFDAGRKLIWGTDTNSQVYVLRMDLKSANVKALQ